MKDMVTARLRLRPITAADVGHVQELDSDPDVIRYASPEYLDEPPTEDQSRAVVQRMLDQDAFWAVEEDGDFIGWFFLRADARGDWELGYRLKRSAWGRGLATEGARAVVDHGFEALRVPMIYAEAVIANAGSVNVLTKLGMTAVSESVWLGMPDRRYELRRP